MIKKQLFCFLLFMVLAMSMTTWANVPPPPVNQNIGIPDRVMNNMSWNTSLECHGDPAIP